MMSLYTFSFHFQQPKTIKPFTSVTKIKPNYFNWIHCTLFTFGYHTLRVKHFAINKIINPRSQI